MNIIITSAGRRGYLVKYFKNALRDNGKVYVGNSDMYSAARVYGDEFILTPSIYSDRYISFLLDFCLQKNVQLVVPLFDPDVLILSRSQHIFRKNGIQILASSEKVVEICNDKWKTYRFCIENGINTPRSFLCVDEAEKAIFSGELGFPLLVKPRWGMGSLEIYQADDIPELKIMYAKCERGIEKTYIKSFQNDSAGVIIQEKLSGQEFGVDIINDLEGNFCCDIVKRKYRMRAGETDCAAIEIRPEIDSLSRHISHCLGHIANLDTDIFESNGRYYLLEMNARFGGGYPFSHLAGINLPAAIIKWLKGDKPESELKIKKKSMVLQKDIGFVDLSDCVGEVYE